MSQEKESGARPSPSRAWLPIVIVVGVVVGIVADLLAGSGSPAQPFGQSQPGFDVLGAYHVILSTLGVALLLALLAVYGRTYRNTRGRFALGLLVIFSALLFQEIFSYPLLASFLANTPFRVGFAGPVADAFRVTAYALFLYISLE